MGDKQVEHWAGEAGDEYHKRNQVDWRKRVSFWHMIMNTYAPQARSVFECGCGPGWNLTAIKSGNPWVEVSGFDINESAREQGLDAGLRLWKDFSVRAEMVITSGFLIHIPPDEIDEVINKIVSLTYRYITVVEYPAAQEEEVVYRGEHDLLWKRPYGTLFEEQGATLIAHGDVADIYGFDDCHWWVFEK